MIKTDDLCDIELRYESTATADEIRNTILKSNLFKEREGREGDGYFYPINEQSYFIKVTKPVKIHNKGISTFVVVKGIELKSTDVSDIVELIEKIIMFAEY